MTSNVSIDPRALFGQRLRQHRIRSGLTQEELAHRAGLDRTYVSSCERGRRNVGLLNVFRLAAALEIDPRELLAEEESPCARSPQAKTL